MSVNEKIMNGDVLVVDDALPKTLYNSIKKMIYDDHFFWNTSSTTAVTTGIVIPGYENGFSFARNIYRVNENGIEDQDPKVTSLLMAGFMCAADSAEISFKQFFRIRIGMITDKPFKHKFHYPHIDANWENTSALLYLTDCDAPTRIYNEIYDGSYNVAPNSPPPDEDPSTRFLKEKYNLQLTVKAEVPSRENRIVFFNGRSYHSSSIPTDTERRIAINFNFI